MTVKAITADYVGEVMDKKENFHGNQLVYIGWDQHLFFCAPFAFPVPGEMPFKALIHEALSGVIAPHPDTAQINWDEVTWLKNGDDFTPDWDGSLSDNGIDHKTCIRFKTPGLNGINGSAN